MTPPRRSSNTENPVVTTKVLEKFNNFALVPGFKLEDLPTYLKSMTINEITAFLVLCSQKVGECKTLKAQAEQRRDDSTAKRKAEQIAFLSRGIEATREFIQNRAEPGDGAQAQPATKSGAHSGGTKAGKIAAGPMSKDLVRP